MAIGYLWKLQLQSDINDYRTDPDITATAIEVNNKQSSPQSASASLSSHHHHRLLYVGEFGLGHRMSKLSAAFHLAKQAGIEQLEVYFGHCTAAAKTKQWDIFHHLFGTNLIRVQSVLNETHNQLFQGNEKQEKVVLVRNDVLGYYAGQAYKNARIPVPRNPAGWLDKLDTDVRFFQYLINRFTEQHAIQYQNFVKTLDSYHVIGVHLRAGNGESEHFAESQRAVNETALFCQQVVDLVAQKLPRLRTRPQSILFLATDTPSLIPIVKKAARQYKLQVITFPQIRLPSNQGVSYASWTEGEKCLDGWKSSMIDMTVLAARADVVVAAMRSTFTQIVPLSMQFAKDDSTTLKFCEVSDSGRDMTCFANRDAWLLRLDQQAIKSYSLDDDNIQPVTHKVMVHLPDLINGTAVEQDGVAAIQRFLKDSSDDNKVFAYGSQFNPKYRIKGLIFQQNWTWMEERQHK
jgi:hypothetical protein